jgi:hypothetical protein
VFGVFRGPNFSGKLSFDKPICPAQSQAHMKAKDIIVIMLLLALVFALGSACYNLGYRNGALRQIQTSEAKGRLGINLAIYKEAQNGDLQAVQQHLGMVILGQTRIYEQEFGVPTSTDSFAQKFVTAQTIAAQIESQLIPVSSILTNFQHRPDAKVPIEKQ